MRGKDSRMEESVSNIRHDGLMEAESWRKARRLWNISNKSRKMVNWYCQLLREAEECCKTSSRRPEIGVPTDRPFSPLHTRSVLPRTWIDTGVETTQRRVSFASDVDPPSSFRVFQLVWNLSALPPPRRKLWTSNFNGGAVVAAAATGHDQVRSIFKPGRV